LRPDLRRIEHRGAQGQQDIPTERINLFPALSAEGEVVESGP
jgi:hypothetical protein